MLPRWGWGLSDARTLLVRIGEQRLVSPLICGVGMLCRSGVVTVIGLSALGVALCILGAVHVLRGGRGLRVALPRFQSGVIAKEPGFRGFLRIRGFGLQLPLAAFFLLCCGSSSCLCRSLLFGLTLA